MQRMTLVLADTSVIAKRNLIKIKRVPEILIFVLVSPIIFVLLFAFVFGNAIDVRGVDYREFLIAGVFTQTVMFGATFTAAGIAEDMQKGIISRFRSLPMSRAAMLTGRTTSDIFYNLASLTIMSLTGLAVGWTVRTSVGEAIAGFALLLLFAYAISWMMASVGLAVPSVEVVNNAVFMVLFPLTFLANTFVPASQLPDGLREFAEWSPVSSVTQAARELFGNIPANAPKPPSWALQHSVLYTLIWVVVIVAIFAPLSVHQYKKLSRTS